MSEAADSARTEGVDAAGIVPAPPAPPPSGGFPMPVPPGFEEAVQSYRPVSMLAGTALTVAVFYTLFIGVGMAIVPFIHAPLLVPEWTFAIPMATLILAWVARAQIQSSEGTLIGLGLTRWTVGLSVCVPLAYGAYYGGTAFAIRQQADTFGRQWIDAMSKGPVEKGFYLSIRPPRPKAGLRSIMEGPRFNGGDMNDPTSLSGFGLATYQRFLQLSGSDTKVNLESIDNWRFEQGGYQVNLNYHITTPLGSFGLRTTVEGIESLTREFPGRQWYARLDHTQIYSDKDTGLKYTEEGATKAQQWGMGALVANQWVGGLKANDLRVPFVYSSPASERERLAKALNPRLTAEEGKTLTAQDKQRIQEFVNGQLAQPDKDGFWANEEQDRKDSQADVKWLFTPGRVPRQFEIKEGKTSVPLVQQDGKRLILRYDYQFKIASARPDVQQPRVTEFRVVVSSENPDPDNRDNWKVDGIELVRTRLVPKSAKLGKL